MDLQAQAPLVLEVYDWLVENSPTAAQKPADVHYPVWVSYKRSATMLPDERTVILELLVDPALVAPVNVAKWGAILNYSYLPANEEDARRHRALLEAYGVSDTKAYLSQFYPQIKREIRESWPRLFDERVQLGNANQYGILWEIRSEWIQTVQP